MHQHEIPAIMRLSLLLVAALLARAAAQQPAPAGGAGAAGPLKPDFYSKTCPRAERIIAEVMQTKQMANPTTAAGVLRVFFHDCFVSGCDASVLIASTQFQKSEHDAEINHSLPGDAFDAVVRAKLALELECPGVVSCADILALASGVLITMTGGPRYQVPLGRKDSLSSSPTAPDIELPHSNFTMDRLIKMFTAKGFTVQELVALSGAHTLGFSHCKEFADRLYNFRNKGGKPEPFDPSMNPSYARGLQDVCREYLKDPTIAAFNDIMTPGKFDNMYFVNLERGLGLLSTDEELWMDPRTKPHVQLYASNPAAFFTDFARAMEKLSLYKVKTGAEGEIRRRCDAYNSGPAVPGGAMSGGATSGSALPGGAMAGMGGGAMPGSAMGGGAMSGSALPGGAMAGMGGGAMPGSAMGGGAMPGGAMGAGAMPGAATAGGAMPMPMPKK